MSLSPHNHHHPLCPPSSSPMWPHFSHCAPVIGITATSLVHTGTSLPWLPPALSLPPCLPPPHPVSTTTSPPSMPPPIQCPPPPPLHLCHCAVPVFTTTTCSPTTAVGSVQYTGAEPTLGDEPEIRLSSSASGTEAGLLQGQGMPAEVIVPPPPSLVCP